MGCCMAQYVKHLTLDFHLGHDFMVMRSSSAWSLLESLPSPPPSLYFFFSLFIKKKEKEKAFSKIQNPFRKTLS